MSPEQLATTSVGPATDAWALGVVLYELLAGVRPFEAIEERLAKRYDLSALKEAAAKRRYPRLDRTTDVPASLSDLVARCLSLDPDERPSAAAIAEHLETLQERGELSTEPPP